MQQQHSYRKFKCWMASLPLLLALALYPPFRSQAQQRQPDKGAQQQDTPGRKPVTPGYPYKTYEALAGELTDAARQLETEMKRMQESELPRMQAEMQKALKEMDAAKLKAEISSSMAHLDWAGIQRQMEASMKQVQAVEMQKAMKAQLSAIDFQKLQQEMQELNTKYAASLEKEMAQARKEIAQNSLNLEETMKEARRHMQAAREEIQQVKKGIDELIKDGIVKKDEAAEIEWDGDVLVVNGKRQSAAVSNKYAAWFRKGTFSIQATPPHNRQ